LEVHWQETGDDAMSGMTPSKPVAEGQIGKINDLLAAKLRKSGLQSDSVQQVLEHQGGQLATDLLAVIRRYTDAVSNTISRCVTVDRSLSPEQALVATGRKQYVNDTVVKTMPNGEGDEMDVFFFNLGRWISDDNLEKEYAARGLVPCDPYTLAKVNQDDPAFADQHPNGTHWKDGDDKWCFAAFLRWNDGRSVGVDRHGIAWSGRWWFAGVRK
jgi:hypothetical protein